MTLIVIKYIFFTGRKESLVCTGSMSRESSKVEGCFSQAKRCNVLEHLQKRGSIELKGRTTEGEPCFSPRVFAGVANLQQDIVLPGAGERCVIEVSKAENISCDS